MERYALGVVIFENPNGVLELLKEISGWTSQPYEIILVDNSNPSLDLRIREFGDLNIKLFKRPSNPGFGAAANIIASEANKMSKTLLLLSHEVKISEHTVTGLVNRLEVSDSTAVCGPTLAYSSNPSKIFSRGGRLTKRGVVWHVKSGRKLTVRTPRWRSVAWVDGSCMAIKLDAIIRCGGFDEAYFLYVEEVDLQARLRLDGYIIEVADHIFAFQEPGSYPVYLRYRNHLYLSQKRDLGLNTWPWLTFMALDLLKIIATDWTKIRPTVRAILKARRDAGTRMGKIDVATQEKII